MKSAIEITDVERGWLAGFYEGEGNAYCGWVGKDRQHRGRYLHIEFTQKDFQPLAMIQQILGATGSVRTNSSGVYMLTYTGHEAVAVFGVIYPLLSDRRKAQIDRARKAWFGRADRRKGSRRPSPGQLRLLG